MRPQRLPDRARARVLARVGRAAAAASFAALVFAPAGPAASDPPRVDDATRTGRAARALVEADVYAELRASGDRTAQVIVILDPGPAPRGEERPARLARVAAVQQGVLARLDPGDFQLGYRYANFPVITGRAGAAALDDLAADARVTRIGADGIVRAARLQNSVPFIRADQGQALGFTGEGVTVAVLDTGIDTNHPDLSDDIAPGAWHFLGQGADQGPGAEDDHGHGTSCSGIVTSRGVVAPPGVAPDAAVLAIKVLGSNGSGYYTDIAAGIDYVTSVAGNYSQLCAISMSLGSDIPLEDCPCDAGTTGEMLNMAMFAARDIGIVSFAASGNDFACNAMGTPACTTAAVAVAAVYDDDYPNPDVVTGFTNRNDCNDLAAPGAGIRTCAIGGGVVNNFGGTSAATPHVAAVAALVADKHGPLGAGTVARILRENGLNTVEPCGTPLPRRVDALASLCNGAGDERAADADDAAPGLRFGSAVALSGETAVVGAPGHAAGGDDSGAAYVLSFDGSSWAQDEILIPADAQPGARFGAAAAAGLNLVVVGAPGDDAGGPESGSAYVFRRQGAAWVQEHKLVPVGNPAGDEFGAAIDVAGDVLVVGAWADDTTNGENGGSASVYRFNGSTWALEQKLIPAGGAADDLFGVGVAVSGDTVLVGAIGDDEAASSAGTVYVYRHDGSNWVQEQKLLASDAENADAFGVSVDLAGSTAAIGAYRDDDFGGLSGAAYVFTHDGSSWLEQQKLLADHGGAGAWFGWSVAVGGGAPGRIAVGAPRAPDNGERAGAAYVFEHDGSQWVQERMLLSSQGRGGDEFGTGVAVNAQIALAGAPFADDPGDDAGVAFFYGPGAPQDCNGNGVLDDCEIADGSAPDRNGDGVPDECACPLDLDGDGAVGVSDLLGLLAAWGSDPGGPPDLDGDGTVGIGDLLELLAGWGPCA